MNGQRLIMVMKTLPSMMSAESNVSQRESGSQLLTKLMLK